MSTSNEHPHGCTCADCAAGHLASSQTNSKALGEVFGFSRFGFERLSEAELCALAEKYLSEREASKQAVYVLALIDHLSRRLAGAPSRLVSAPVMTDFALAIRLLEVGDFIAAYARSFPTTSETAHLKTISEAVNFLRGNRPKSGLSHEEVERLVRNDPAVNRIFMIAHHIAREEFERGSPKISPLSAADTGFPNAASPGERAELDAEIEEHRARYAVEMAKIGAEPHVGEIPEGTIMVPDFCESCKTAVIHRHLVAAESDPWQSWVVLVQMLLLNVLHADEEAGKSAGAQDLQGQLVAIGCLGCRYPRAMKDAALMVRHRGAVFVGKVIRGEEKAINFDPKALARRRT